jgi:hypothetical protein
MGDPYDAYRDRQLTSGGGRDRPRPKWAQEADKQRYAEGVTSAKAQNAMWPGPAIEHGPPKPRREDHPNRQVHRERFT